jgi:hypothetical protein
MPVSARKPVASAMRLIPVKSGVVSARTPKTSTNEDFIAMQRFFYELFGITNDSRGRMDIDRA